MPAATMPCDGLEENALVLGVHPAPTNARRVRLHVCSLYSTFSNLTMPIAMPYIRLNFLCTRGPGWTYVQANAEGVLH